MPTYNLTKPEDREAFRADRQSELDAIERGEWPRDINDVMRWSPPQRRDGTYTVEPGEWAARMCRADLQYLATKDPPIGFRVELHPACDLWMQGARFGTVRAVEPDGTLKIKMDHPQVKKLIRVAPDLVTFRCSRCLGEANPGCMPSCTKGCK